MSSQDDSGELSTFREAEVLGLKLMQERKYEAALKGKEQTAGAAGERRNSVCRVSRVKSAKELTVICFVLLPLPPRICITSSLQKRFDVTG
jgi:hypothetical protein